MRQRKGNLPADVTSFVGRRSELSTIQKLMTSTRLLTLTGVGGVGKTRLAIRVAAGAQRAFPDGVWLVELASLQDPRLLAQTVADTLGLRGHPVQQRQMDTLIDYLLDKHLLLILDNCEHLLDACADLASALLRTDPEVRILATSRESLRVPGERLFVVPPLSLPKLDEVAQCTPDALSSEAVTMFAERAAAAEPTFTFNAENSQSVVRLCRRLDGIPLALELAAVRVRALSIGQLVARLDDCIGLLDCGKRAVRPPHRTLRALIDWSFDLCTPDERTLWARLSVFSGGFDLEAAEAVCGSTGLADHDILSLLSDLVDKSIITVDRSHSWLRYRMLEPLRQYGREKLAASGEEAALRRRHRDHYQQIAERMYDNWFGPGQEDWYSYVAAEHANLRAAIDYCLTVPGQAEAGLRIVSALRVFWISSGFFAEGCRALDQFLALDASPTPTRARALRDRCWLALLQGDIETGRRMLPEQRALAEALQDGLSSAWTTLLTGLTVGIGGDLARAEAFLDKAVAEQRETGDPMGECCALFYTAIVAVLRGDVDRAAALCDEAYAVSAERDEHWYASCALWTGSIVAWRRSDIANARKLVLESLHLRRHFVDCKYSVIQCLEVLTWIHVSEGHFALAARLFGALSVLWRRCDAVFFKHLEIYHDECEQRTAAALGEKRFADLMARGETLSLDAALAEAIGEKPAGHEEDSKAAADGPLTHREREVARLVVQGLTNKEIAATLVIAQRTAEGHVENILNKLGFTSRAQIAAWASQELPQLLP
ncbi:LuxR C-terminal-related transcriptional regulator [Planotetraspora sp. A-T 1434]|uniref:ATP-binding protein n=1 Tax=Planotetraspora sp. A-T 1434 TaxID=2979219 RepID=UPI0021C21F0F|nr:LuxR C-terminal-related transcriptional regulator [Planotetraspora sp. A-T 1434]MCT9931462.1 LuxR C-terminal-related transcriptional regulator [Planotetraspora sp. A-T 1434]